MLAVLVVVELPGALQRCIFDEVQAQVDEVRPAPMHPDSPPNKPRLRPPTGQYTSHRGRRMSPLRGLYTSPTPASPQPIRIHTWIPRESSNLSDAEKDRMMSALEEAVRMVSSLLSVNRAPGPLLLSRDINKYCKFLWSNSRTTNYNRCGRANSNYRNETCLDVTIPDDHLAGCDIYPEPDSPRRTVLRPEGAGLPDTDFLLYLHIQSTDKCRAEPNVLAYAVRCQADTHGRPVAGVVVICRDKLTAATYNHHATVQTVIHELFHTLGFSKDLFHTWKDCSSSPQVGAGCSPRGKVIHSDGSGQMRIYTPSVISALQKHLASTDPELGGPLENLVLRVQQSLPTLTTTAFLTCVKLPATYLPCLPPSGCTFRQSVLSLGVPGPEGVHHGSGAGGLDHSPDRPGHFSCITGHGLVHGQPEPGTESGLGRQ
ncbi:ciliated left-right organizer metallopeptidase isoform X2 [Seriola aureovittata]|nr:ciliated left-right organizer metallopeptidase isoform X2 [Seriola aureovittata]